MKMPVWLKPALLGACAGAAVLYIFGFAAGGWMSGSEAERLAGEHARAEVMAAMLPICTHNATADAHGSQTFARMKEAPYHDRSQMVMDAGWATLPGTQEPNATLAVACVKALEF